MNQENTSAPAENKMGTMPIGKLLFNMSLPMMISMLVQALYNIVDSIFVAKLSENALTAVSLAFPLQTLPFYIFSAISFFSFLALRSSVLFTQVRLEMLTRRSWNSELST